MEKFLQRIAGAINRPDVVDNDDLEEAIKENIGSNLIDDIVKKLLRIIILFHLPSNKRWDIPFIFIVFNILICNSNDWLLFFNFRRFFNIIN